MYFCNMVGEGAVKLFTRNGKVDFLNEVDKVAENVSFVLKDESVFVDENGSVGSLFLKGLKGVGTATYNEKLSKTLTIADVEDTPENPLIVCLCREITVYDGVPADIKIMSLDDEVALVMLISGKVDIDGSPLVRCKEVLGIERKTKTFKAKDFRTFGNFVDEESDYNFYADAIHHIRINYRSKGESIGYANIKEDQEFLTTRGLESARQRAAEKRRIAEERRQQKEAERAKMERIQKEKEEAKQAKIEREEAEQRRASAQEFLRQMMGCAR